MLSQSSRKYHKFFTNYFSCSANGSTHLAYLERPWLDTGPRDRGVFGIGLEAGNDPFILLGTAVHLGYARRRSLPCSSPRLYQNVGFYWQKRISCRSWERSRRPRLGIHPARLPLAVSSVAPTGKVFHVDVAAAHDG